MNISQLLTEWRNCDIKVWVENDRLKCSAPAGAMTPELQNHLRQHREDILRFLRSVETLARQQPAIVPLQPKGNRIPIFAVGGHNGDVFCYRALAKHVGDDQPFYGLEPPGLHGGEEPVASVVELAKYFAKQIRAFLPTGSCIIAGYCAGGSIAFELARQLRKQGVDVSSLIMLGTPFPSLYRRWPQMRLRLQYQWQRVVHHTRELASLSWPARGSYIAGRFQNRRDKRAADLSAAPDPVKMLRDRVERATIAAASRYVPGHFSGPVFLLLPSRAWAQSFARPLRWRSVTREVREYFGPDGCNSDVMLREPHAKLFAEMLDRCCRLPSECVTHLKNGPKSFSLPARIVARIQAGFSGVHQKLSDLSPGGCIHAGEVFLFAPFTHRFSTIPSLLPFLQVDLGLGALNRSVTRSSPSESFHSPGSRSD